MKGKVFVLVLLGLLVIPLSVQAMDTTSNSNRDEVKKEVIGRLKNQKKENVEEYSRKLITRYSGAIEKLSEFTKRIESRVDKISNRNPNLNLSEVKLKLSEVGKKIDTSKNNLAEIEKDFKMMLESDRPFKAFGETREDIKKLKSDLMDIKKLLISIVDDLKGLKNEKE